MRSQCVLLSCTIWIIFQFNILTIRGDNGGFDAPVKELCPCLPREVCPHNHALSLSVSARNDDFICRSATALASLAILTNSIFDAHFQNRMPFIWEPF